MNLELVEEGVCQDVVGLKGGGVAGREEGGRRLQLPAHLLRTEGIVEGRSMHEARNEEEGKGGRNVKEGRSMKDCPI